MRTWKVIVLTVAAFGFTGCTTHEARSGADRAKEDLKQAGREIREGSDSAARKAGRAAHQLAEETKEVAGKVERGLKKASKEAKAGWEEAKEKSDKQ